MSKNSKHTAPPGDLKGSFLRMIFIIQAIWANRPSPQNLLHWQLHQLPQQSEMISFVLFWLLKYHVLHNLNGY